MIEIIWAVIQRYNPNQNKCKFNWPFEVHNLVVKFWTKILTYLLSPKWNKMLCTMSTMVETVFYFVRKDFSNVYQLLVSRSVTFSFPLNYSESFEVFECTDECLFLWSLSTILSARKVHNLSMYHLILKNVPTVGAKMIESQTNYWLILNTEHFPTKNSLKKKFGSLRNLLNLILNIEKVHKTQIMKAYKFQNPWWTWTPGGPGGQG